MAGSNDIERRRQLEALESQWAQQWKAPCDRIILDLENASLQQVAEAVETVPLFGGPRLVWLQNLDRAASDLLEYLAARLPPGVEQTLVVLSAEKLDARKAPVKKLENVARVIQVDPPASRDLLPWMKQQAEELGLRLGQRELEMVREVVGEDPLALRTELEKLALYPTASGVLEEQELAVLLSRTLPWAAETAIFQLVDAVVEGRGSRALRILRQLIAVGRPALVILQMLARQYRMLVLACGNPRLGADGIARELGVAPFAARKAMGQARRLSLQEALKGLEAILEADEQIKLGWDDTLALEVLVGKLTLPRR